MKRNKILLILSVVGLAVAASVYATRSFRGPDYEITASSTSGGGKSAGGGYELLATIGQPEAGELTGGEYTLTGGFLARSSCTRYDLNHDGFPSIVGDVELFVRCVFFNECDCPGGCDCPADCNCDGFLSIVGDVECFVNCVFFNNCQDCPARSTSAARGGGFTIGGAVYDDESNPLFSGAEGVTVEVLGADEKVAASTMTAGPTGIWRVNNVSKGTYTVVIGREGPGRAPRPHSVTIVVNEENMASNQSIQWLRTPQAQGVGPAEVKKIERGRSD